MLGGGEIRTKGRFPVKNKRVNSYTSYGINEAPNASSGSPTPKMKNNALFTR